MVHVLRQLPEKFGTLLGYAPGGVAIYSSHYPSLDANHFADQSFFHSFIDDLYMGYKWQCVEFARRWLFMNYGYVFGDVAMAYDIFALRHARRIVDSVILPLQAIANGGMRAPEVGSLLIWGPGGEFEITGHVAVITEVLAGEVRIAEQNFEHGLLPPGQEWCRSLVLQRTVEGGYRITAASPEETILGWVIQSNDSTHAMEHFPKNPQLFELSSRSVADVGQAKKQWLNEDSPIEGAYVSAMGGHYLTAVPSEQYRYIRLSATAEKELARATNELHLMFLHATQIVLQDEALLAHFNIPQSLWPRLRRSWERRRGQMITGRFDFCMTAAGLKAYEYNADSASCHLETGLIQGKWAAFFGCSEGRDVGARLFDKLIRAWRQSGVDGLLHIMQDRDKEETYHALYMQSAIEAAGIRCKIIKGFNGLGWNARGEVVDSDGEPIRWVWKTWAWETALDQLRAECEADDLQPRVRTFKQDQPIRLVDVLLRPEVMVFEPLWTLIPSNKAILPILWSIFPGHPYLLDTQFELTEALSQAGYVVKPIAGRCGFNISLFGREDHLLDETKGKFEHQSHIYQELCQLPSIDGYRVQVCSFSVNGSYAGACVRVDSSPIITTHSDLLALRVVDDEML